jgi:hypothetical protein
MVRTSPERATRLPVSYAERLFGALVVTAVGLALAGILLNLAALPVTTPTVWPGALEFDGARALAVTTEFVTTFPDRYAGGPQKAQSAQWLVDHFVELGYDAQARAFGAWVGGRYCPDLANVWAVRRGRLADTIVIHAHYDIPAFVTQGAADDGSGIGAIFELARVLSDEIQDRTVVFAVLDAGEYGSVGAELFADRKPFPEPIIAAVGLDFLNPGNLVGVSVECPGTQKGYTPPWLKALAEESAVAEAGKAFAPGLLTEWIERSVAVAPTDTGMFLRRRIPAVNLAGVPSNSPRERALYHTREDTIGNLTADSFTKWGRTAERVVRTLTSAAELPGKREMRQTVYLGLGGDRYLPGWAVRAVQFLIFAPLWAVVGLGWRRRRRSLGPALAILAAEARRVFTLAGCLLVGLLVMKLTALAGLLTRYEMYPATAKDPALYHPAIIPLALALLAMGGAYYAVRRFTLWLAPPLGADWSERYHALTTLLAAAVFLTWLEGAGYGGVTFLALPAYLWIFLAEPTGRAATARRVSGGLLVVAGTAAFVAFLAVVGEVLVVGPSWWYVILGATFGLFSLKASLVFLTVAVLHGEAFAAGVGIGAGWVDDSSRLSPSGRMGAGHRLRRGV